MKHKTVKTKGLRLSQVRGLCRLFAKRLPLHKFTYACNRMSERADKALEKIDQAIEKKRIELAATDDKGIMIVDEKGNPQIPKSKLEGFQSFIQQQLEKEVEVETWITEHFDPIKDNLEALEILNGFVINVDIEKLLEAKTS